MTYFNLLDFFDATVDKHPDRLALIEENQYKSFSSLKDDVTRLALSVSKKLEGEINKIVSVYLPKGIDSVTADIAVGYSGNTYMNLDIKYPSQRIINILDSIRPSLVITQRELYDSVAHLFKNVPILFIDEKEQDKIEQDKKNYLTQKRNQVIDTDLLCIINTSGSTGTPKGVALTHRGFIDLIKSEEKAGILDSKHEVIASLAPIVFDHHSFEIALLAMHGATLLLIPEKYAAFPVKMLSLMKEHRATFLLWVPTIMVNIANMDLLSKIELDTLRKVWFAGEVFPTTKFNYWKRMLPGATFVNLYGPTEISVDCTYYVIPYELNDTEEIPIGKPLPNTRIYLLDEDGAEVGVGKEGEICVKGTCLAAGYYNNKEKSTLSFIQNPLNSHYPDKIYRTGDIGVKRSDGEIVFKGRKDTLIKHMGYRIELGEIENVIIALNVVSNCCAVYHSEKKRIVLFYESSELLDEKMLRLSISRVLPRYMVPSVYCHLEVMPRNNNGKIDRLKLKNMIH